MRSSALVGGASAVNIALGIVRTKAMAILLGPAGIGLIGLYNSISELAQSIATMGLNNSGVRQIAEAVGTEDTNRVARTATVLRRISMLLGFLGAVLVAGFSTQISIVTFGTGQRTGAVALLSLAVFFGAVTAGQSALIQGLRRIGDLAKLGIIGAVLGTVVSIPIIYFFREKGVVPALVIVAGIASITAWWYGRKIDIPTVPMTTAQVRGEVAALLKLGFAFMACGFLTMAAAYVIRIIIVRKIGLDSAGLYQSAWVLGGLYVGFILQAMGADFYPRLTAVSRDNEECNRLVNEQAQVSLLLAGPGVIGTLTFAPLVLALFYSPKFGAAVDILRWICLGMTLRVISWPIGFIIVAKGEQKIFFWTEVAVALIHVGLAWWWVPHFGLAGAGAAFFGLYVWHSLFVYAVTRRLSGFRWSLATKRIIAFFLPLVAVVFVGFYLLPPWLATTIGTLCLVVGSAYALRSVVQLASPSTLPRSLRRLLVVLRLAPAEAR